MLGHPGSGTPHAVANATAPTAPLPPLKINLQEIFFFKKKKGETQHRDSRECLIFYDWEKIVSLCEEETVRMSVFCKDDRVWLKHQ